MKKILLATTAVAGVALFANAASAEVKLNLGGYFAGYGVYSDSDEPAGTSLRQFDLRRDTEIHVSGETTLDNGLTVGFHTEQDLGGATQTDEVYGYFSGGWGRVNLGSEDGAAYLLQVAAPSADSNVDSLRTYIQAIDSTGLGDITTGTVANQGSTGFLGGADTIGLAGSTRLDYDQVSDVSNGGTTNTDRLTYLTPKFNGFQAGVSYAPEQGQNSTGNGYGSVTSDNESDQYQNIWDASARWDGEFQGFGLSVGGGYSTADLERKGTIAAATAGNIDLAPVVSDGVKQWNTGVNVAWNAFSLGATYLTEKTENVDRVDVGNTAAGTNASGTDTLRKLDVTRDTYVVGAAWDNGPWHVGASYLNQKTERDASGVAADDGEVNKLDAKADRITVGAGYTFGPGMTFRGAVAWGKFDRKAVLDDTNDTAGVDGLSSGLIDRDFTQVTIGTDIQF